MTLEELKRKEKELRKKYGDDLYEKLYMQQYNREKTTTAPPAAMTKPPAYTATPRTPNPPNLPGNIQPPKAPGKLGPDTYDDKIENTFYTSKTNSGIMPNNLKSIQDFRGTIVDLDKRIADLNKEQFNTMLTGDGKRTAAFDSLIKNTESIRDGLKEQLARVMGIGSESADKDMLRKGGGSHEPTVQIGMKKTPSSRMQFNADEPRQVMGLDGEGEKEEYPPKPSPMPVPGAPPKEGNKQEDSNILGDIGGAISDAGEWIADKATGALKWLKDNRDEIGHFNETERKRLFETPITELSLDDLEKRKDIQLKGLKEKFEKQKTEEIDNFKIDLKNEWLKSYDTFSNDEKYWWKLNHDVDSAQEFADIAYEIGDWEEIINRDITQKYNEKYEEAIKDAERQYKRYISIAEVGLSDLWGVRDSLKDSDVKNVIERVLKNIPSLQYPDINHPATSSEFIDVCDEDMKDAIYLEEVEQYEDLDKYMGIMRDIGLSLSPGGIGSKGINVVYQFLTKAPIAIDILDTAAKNSRPKTTIDKGKYMKYDIAYSGFANGYNSNLITIFVEVDDEGKPINPPHVYAYDRTLNVVIQSEEHYNASAADWLLYYYEYVGEEYS